LGCAGPEGGGPWGARGPRVTADCPGGRGCRAEPSPLWGILLFPTSGPGAWGEPEEGGAPLVRVAGGCKLCEVTAALYCRDCRVLP
jgi:hypothetical protein